MTKVDRREFLKLVGAGGVGTGAGFILAESIKHPVEHLIPYPVPPEEFSPGIATWYNSVCGMCSAGCGISVRTREGRAKKIEGNPSHPVNQGRLCALGQAGLQVLYNPDRLTAPMLQTGERGGDTFVETTWDEALARAAGPLNAARERGGRVVFLTEGVRGHLANLIDRFMLELLGEAGPDNVLHYDFADPHALHAANERLFGERQLPYYDIRNARYVLSFGADYLTTWLSPVHNALGFGHSRQGNAGSRGRFVQIEPRMSLSGAAADEWLPVRPGSEGFLALGIAYGLVADGRYRADDIAAWRSALGGYSPRRVAEATGVPAETVTRLAREFGHAEPALAIGGSAAAAPTNGVDTLIAVNALNYLVGNLGKPGGVVFNPPPVVGGVERRANFRTMQNLIEAARAGGIDVLIVNSANPAFTLPRAAGFMDALASIPTIVSLSSFLDETTLMADVMLPSHTYLESWSDDVPHPGVGFSVAAVSQPVVAPLYKTRATGDILLSLAGKVGLAEAFPWPSMEEYLKAGWRQIYERDQASVDFDAFWRDVLIAGVWGENVRREESKRVDADVVGGIRMAAPRFAGDAGDYPFVLHPYLSTAMHDGRGANLPWMQELPDPMTGIVYGSWVELNPATAKELGVGDGDVVTVTSNVGSIEAPVVVFPAIMPDVVAMPVGQGHTALGRYARNRGANPLEILAPETDPASGSLATGATRVALTATGKRAAPVRTGGESRQLGRGIVQWTGGAGSPGHGAQLNSIPIKVESV